MNRSYRFRSALRLLGFLTAACSQAAFATIVDFNNMAPGTPASAGNAYDGVLNIDAREGAVGFPSDPQFRWVESTIQPGLGANHSLLLASLWHGASAQGGYYAQVTATFLAPVTDVSFDGFAYRPAFYEYTAVNGSGDIFTGSGGLPTTGTEIYNPETDWSHIDLPAPAGYYVTQFSVSNHDPKTFDSGVWLDNISFTKLTAVPETAPTVVLLAFGFVGMVALRRFCFRSGSKARS